jgi:hypothetical protein
MTEHWLAVVGFEGLYEVSDLGRVRGLDRTVPHKRLGSCRRKGFVLKQFRDANYVSVNLHRHGCQQKFCVHTLVLNAFVGSCPPGMQGCHFPDRDTSNNRLENLRWDTRSANQLDAVYHRTNFNASKICCPKCGGEYMFRKDGSRRCRPCNNKWQREYSRRRAA